MKVVADENIPGAREAFAELGPVRLLPGRDIAKESLRDCDALFVRTVTRADEALLGGTSVRFVGTATIGTDHVDRTYLESAGIGFASAFGSNANSVAEYVVCALLCLAERKGMALAGRRLGVVGVGNVGRRVVRYAAALGLSVLQNDPPRARREGGGAFHDLDALMDADFVTLHVPLARVGADATWHLFDARRLRALRRDAMLINTARGAVVDNTVLRDALAAGTLGGAVLDVFEGEPTPDPALVLRADIATPHIAGYSLDGKLTGTEQVARAAARFFGTPLAWTAASALPAPRLREVRLDAGLTPELSVWRAVRSLYDIEADDAALRRLLGLTAADRGRGFDRLRNEYPVRREFHNTRLLGGEGGAARAMLEALGFQA